MRVLHPEISAEVCVALAEQSLQLWHERLCHQIKANVRDILSRKQRATTPGELINIDVCGPMQQEFLGGAKFYVYFKYDFTKYRRVFFKQFKNEVSKCLETFLNEAKNAGHMVEHKLSDSGGEVINSTEKSIFQKFGISSRMPMPCTHQQNRAAERENKTIVESARSVIYDTNLPLKL
ncbi:retrovirus-related Pol polyprotein from transposon TNT 1-94 [Trichonephila clavipes]|nr:retrovirus-related Pol polyprotein from transposon TNT 1-94 [Trichonephila clavipes]